MRRPVLGWASGRVFDAGLALVLFGLGEVQIYSPDPHRVIANKSFSAAVWAVTALALVWRRRSPRLVFVIVVAGLTMEALPAPDSGTFAGFVALCVALYTVARANPQLETVVAATATALVALLFHYSRDPMASNAVENIQATYLVLVACPVIARLVSGRAAQSAALHAELARQQQRREDTARRAVAAERARIARELHDVIAHGLTVTIVQSMAANAAAGDGGTDNPLLDDIRRRLSAIEETSRHALADMRRLVTIDGGSGPAQAQPQPRIGDLAALVDRLRAGGTLVRLDQHGDWTDVSPGAHLALLRITQEALTNAIKHAPGAVIEVRVSRTPSTVETLVTNGPATEPGGGPGSGRGLLGMRERVQLYAGTLHTGPSPDGGYQVHAALPVVSATG